MQNDIQIKVEIKQNENALSTLHFAFYRRCPPAGRRSKLMQQKSMLEYGEELLKILIRCSSQRNIFFHTDAILLDFKFSPTESNLSFFPLLVCMLLCATNIFAMMG